MRDPGNNHDRANKDNTGAHTGHKDGTSTHTVRQSQERQQDNSET